MKRCLYYIITIDTECDKSLDWTTPQPMTFRNIYNGVQNLFQPFCDRHQIKPTYLLSPEILFDKESINIFKSFSSKCELGTHMHSEYVEPIARWDTEMTDEYQADLGYELEFLKMKNLTNIFKETFGYSPVSFRAGRFGMGDNTINILSKLGYKVDSSMFPLHCINTINKNFNYFTTPLFPFFPYLPTDNSDCNPILELPITVYSKLYYDIPYSIRKPVSKSRIIKAILKNTIGINAMKVFSLRPSSYSFADMQKVVDSYLAIHQNQDNVFFVMMFHSNELTEGTSPYNRSKCDLNEFMKRLEHISNYILNLDAQPILMQDSFNIVIKNKK